ncbi:uncharacterized protein [Ptychodera flava]|uniref:uncharacterized protein n=1 Tax=Ptychodera flava TaxID=63121 RepID=UPI00396A7AE5
MKMNRRDFFGRRVTFGRPSTSHASLGYHNKSDHTTCLHSLCDDCLERVLETSRIAKNRPRCPECHRYYPVPADAETHANFYGETADSGVKVNGSRDYDSFNHCYDRKPPSPGCIECAFSFRHPAADHYRQIKSASTRHRFGPDNDRDKSIYANRYATGVTQVLSPEIAPSIKYGHVHEYGDSTVYGQRFSGFPDQHRPITRGKQLSFSRIVTDPEMYSRDYDGTFDQEQKHELVPSLRGRHSRVSLNNDYPRTSAHWQSSYSDSYQYPPQRASNTRVSYTIPKYVIYGQPETILFSVVEWYNGKLSRSDDHEISALLERPDGTTRPLKLVQHSMGKFVLHFCESFHGKYRLKVFIDGQRLPQSPFMIEVIDGWLMGKRMKVGTTVIRGRDMKTGLMIDDDCKGRVIKATEEFNRGWWISVQWDCGGDVCQYNMNRYSSPLKLYDFYTN